MTVTAEFPDRALAEDAFLWLEEIHAEPALAWVTGQNALTEAHLPAEALAATTARMLDVLDSVDRIPMVTRRGDYLYNFWRDAAHPRGLWRRTTLEQYRTAETAWDVLLDVDALGQREGVEWVWGGADLLYPTYDRALVRLSPDGGDAVSVREFDLETREFVADGFKLPTAKLSATWIDRDTIFVSTDFGPDTLTTSSYPRQVRRWRRGTPLDSAGLVLEVPVDHMGAWAGHDHTPGFERDLVIDRIDFWRSRAYLADGDELAPIEVPDDAEVDVRREWLLVSLRSDWDIAGQVFAAGSLLATRLESFLDGERVLEAVFTPDPSTSLVDFGWTRNHLLLTELRDVQSRVEVLTPGPDEWERQELGTIESNQTVHVAAVDPDESDDYWQVVNGYVQPSMLQLGAIGTGFLETLKSEPAFFDGSAFRVEQHFATSDDGTKVPYFQVAPRDLAYDGQAPTILRGYGGFEIPQLPGYDGMAGRAWLERGGVMVFANIRGGGEYGPAWHHAALRENRPRAYEDFAAVAKDLIERKVTSPAHLGCLGRSNGGLLVGNMLTHYPELFGAIVCGVPLLDMKRYTKLSAGTSWIAEYGDPDNPDDWAFIQEFSPYHNLRERIAYPPVLFYTATSDDRVGPVQARKMAARMQERGIRDVYLYENREGGHAGSADNAQAAHMHAMSYEFMWHHLA